MKKSRLLTQSALIQALLFTAIPVIGAAAETGTPLKVEPYKGVLNVCENDGNDQVVALGSLQYSEENHEDNVNAPTVLIPNVEVELRSKNGELIDKSVSAHTGNSYGIFTLLIPCKLIQNKFTIHFRYTATSTNGVMTEKVYSADYVHSNELFRYFLGTQSNVQLSSERVMSPPLN